MKSFNNFYFFISFLSLLQLTCNRKELILYLKKCLQRKDTFTKHYEIICCVRLFFRLEIRLKFCVKYYFYRYQDFHQQEIWRKRAELEKMTKSLMKHWSRIWYFNFQESREDFSHVFPSFCLEFLTRLTRVFPFSVTNEKKWYVG